MSEVETGVKRPHPFQKHCVPPKLKMARSGQGWQRLKTFLILLQPKSEAGDNRIKLLVQLSWGCSPSVPPALL